MPKPKAAAGPEANGNGHKPTIAEISVKEIKPSMLWPQIERRKYFDQTNLSGLIHSIVQNGFQGAVTARPVAKGYELVAGERRWLAAQAAGLSHIPATIAHLDDHQALEFQLAENLERKELTPLDEALTYKFMIEQEGYTVQTIAAKFAKSEKVILRRLKLGDLIEEGRKLIAEEVLPLKHAEFVCSFPESTQRKILQNDLLNWDKQPKKLSDLIRTVQDKYVLTLSTAPFKKNDAELHPTAGSCEACPKRTGFIPGLFTDTLGDADRCLDKSCWDKKIKNLIDRRRAEIAAKLPNPKNLPVTELIHLVPLIKTEGSHNYTVSHDKKLQVFVRESYFKPTNFVFVTVIGKDERCSFMESAVRIANTYSEGKGKAGQVQLICRSKKCSVHKMPSESTNSGGYDWVAEEKKRNQRNLEEKCRNGARLALLPRLIESNEARDIFVNEATRGLLLAFMIETISWQENQDFEALPDLISPDLRELIKDSSYPRSIEEFQKFTAADLNRLAAAILFINLTRDDQAQPIVQKLASDVPDYNYNLEAAKTFVEIVPETKKAVAEEYLAKVEKGQTPKFPAIYWPEDRAKKASKLAKG